MPNIKKRKERENEPLVRHLKKTALILSTGLGAR